jgi:DNA polymerase I-like protein with 3'-5' exonuclease and polymerase domains
MLPSELPDEVERPAVDTETGTIVPGGSALFPDDGARVADVSVAWHRPDGGIESHAWRFWDARGQEPECRQCREEWDALCPWLEGRDGLVFHNALFDTTLMLAGTGSGFPGIDLLPLVCWDTALVAGLTDPGEMVGLDSQLKSRFGMADKKTALEPIKKWLSDARREVGKERAAANRVFDSQVRRGQITKAEAEACKNREMTPEELLYETWAYYMAPWPMVKEYAAVDAMGTIMLARNQWQRIAAGECGDSRKMFDLIDDDLRVMRSLARMERRGVPYARDPSLEVARCLRRDARELEAALPFEGEPTPDTLRVWFYEKQGVKPLKWTKGGKTGKKKPSMDKETLEWLATLEGVPGAAEYRRWKEATGAEARWYRPFAEATAPDGRMRPRFRQTSVRSGRLSIERIQLQAVPHDHVLARSDVLGKYPTPRKLIRPELGWALWDMDLSQAELRVAAGMAKAAKMLEIIREGRDPHGELATQAFSVRPGDDEWFQYRQVGKRGDFSLIFGIGRDRLRADVKTQTGIEMPWEDVDRLRDTFREMHPEFGYAIKRTSQVVLKRYFDSGCKVGWVDLVNGRRNCIPGHEMDRDWDEENQCSVGPAKGSHKAFNRKVQGSIGEFAKAWMVAVDQYLMEQLRWGPEGSEAHGLLLQVHDSLVVSVPDNPWGEQLAKDCRQIGLDLWVPWFEKEYGVPGGIDIARWGEK